jgi:hypothetical protein
MYLRKMIRKRKESNSIDVFLFHGWALSPTSWDKLIESFRASTSDLSKYKYNFHLYDRGYFSDIETKNISSGIGASIVVTHSLGLHFVPLSLLHKADFIFVISGFMNFHKFGGAHTKRLVNKMIERLQLEPLLVLKEFYKNMYLPHVINPDFMENEFAHINIDRLKNDLHFLNDHIITQRIFSDTSKIILLHGEKDVISSPRHTLNWMIKMNNISGRIISNAGHALQLTHPGLLAQYIIAQVEKT